LSETNSLSGDLPGKKRGIKSKWKGGKVPCRKTSRKVERKFGRKFRHAHGSRGAHRFGKNEEMINRKGKRTGGILLAIALANLVRHRLRESNDAIRRIGGGEIDSGKKPISLETVCGNHFFID